jgi:hypothetical protein
MKTVIHYYNYNTRDEKDAKAYAELCEKLTGQGLHLFDSISREHSHFYRNLIAPLNGQEIELETEHLFNNQWNSAPTKTSEKGLRVFDWSEAIHENRSLKQGMWLEQTEEMTAIRALTYKCNYCGKQYFKTQQSFCTACIGSEYLKESELELLFLTPVSADKTRFGGVNLPDGFVEQYHTAQKAARTVRLQEQQDRKLADLQQEITAAQKQFDAFSLLIANNIDFDNVIYYKHTDTFNFGWRRALSSTEQQELWSKLDACGFLAAYKTTFEYQ